MDFAAALILLKTGQPVVREADREDGVWVTIAEGARATINEAPMVGRTAKIGAFFARRMPKGDFVPARLSDADLLADDWMAAG